MRLALGVSILGFAPALAHADARPPMGATKIAIDYEYQSFHSNELHYKLVWDKTGYRGDNKVAVDAKLVDALYASLTDLKPFDDDIRCISHTDDYPHFTITIDGDSPVVIDSQSNCHANVPWNVIRNGKHAAQFDGKIPKAVYALLAAVDAKNWKTGPDSPEASMSFGQETVGIGAFSPSAHMSTPSAMACVKDEETSPIVKRAFGASPKVEELSLECDLGASADCAQLVAESEFTWDGVSLQIGLACNGGVIDVPTPTLDKIAELRAFVDSTPMRTLVRMSSATPPRVWNNRGEWMSEGQFDDPPSITFQPGTATVHIRAIGENGPGAVKYLTALGIDPKSVTKHSSGAFYETDLDVDFKGHVVAAGIAPKR